jgi:hypothetical protein
MADWRAVNQSCRATTIDQAGLSDNEWQVNISVNKPQST